MGTVSTVKEKDEVAFLRLIKEIKKRTQFLKIFFFKSIFMASNIHANSDISHYALKTLKNTHFPPFPRAVHALSTIRYVQEVVTHFIK